MIDRLQPFVPQRAQQTRKTREELEPFDLGIGPSLDRTFDRFEGRRIAQEVQNEKPSLPLQGNKKIRDAYKGKKSFHELCEGVKRGYRVDISKMALDEFRTFLDSVVKREKTTVSRLANEAIVKLMEGLNFEGEEQFKIFKGIVENIEKGAKDKKGYWEKILDSNDYESVKFFITEISKTDSPQSVEYILQNLDMVINRLDGIDLERVCANLVKIEKEGSNESKKIFIKYREKLSKKVMDFLAIYSVLDSAGLINAPHAEKVADVENVKLVSKLLQELYNSIPKEEANKK